ncbi:MAG: type II toxin-antitoxin system VapC family toxin [Deltaproteobacteria bacterium]|nr:type II toxin-antitoxin system VapC family toxin [Deltaproteobacteria bacterium]
MEDSLVLETTFLVDLEREAAREKPGRAVAFLEKHLDDKLHITFTIAGEIACGTSLSERKAWERFIGPFKVLGFSLDVAWEYGRAFRFLEENGLLIGANDLWIAATAIAYEIPVVTRNAKHYRRVPGLSVLEY